LNNPATRVDFIGVVKDQVKPGEHFVVISIVDARTRVQYVSHTAAVEVVDYAFDHVSRPRLQTALTLVAGSGAAVMWVMTYIGRIDLTWGVAMGATVTTVTTFLVWRISQFYRTTTTRVP
jgi:hypothetical protein